MVSGYALRHADEVSLEAEREEILSSVGEKTEQAKKESAKRTRRTFLIGGLSAAAGYEFYHWLGNAPGDQMLPRPLRKVMNFNAAVVARVVRRTGAGADVSGEPGGAAADQRELWAEGSVGRELVPACRWWGSRGRNGTRNM